MLPRPGPDPARRGRSGSRCHGAGGLLLLALSAAAPAAVAVERQEAPRGYKEYQQAMNDFLAGEFCRSQRQRQEACRPSWKAARRGIERVLDEYPRSMQPGEPVQVKRGLYELYLPDYYLGLCLCELGETDAGKDFMGSVTGWYSQYPALQDYVDLCVIPYCGKSLPEGCDRPRDQEPASTRPGRSSASSPRSGRSSVSSAPRCAAASPGDAAW